jgi:hypothetical protein
VVCLAVVLRILALLPALPLGVGAAAAVASVVAHVRASLLPLVVAAVGGARAAALGESGGIAGLVAGSMTIATRVGCMGCMGVLGDAWPGEMRWLAAPGPVAPPPHAADASVLLKAAHFTPVLKESGRRMAGSILHLIPESIYRAPATGSFTKQMERICREVEKTRIRHRDRQIVFCVPSMPSMEFVQLISGIAQAPGQSAILELTHTVSDAVARLIQGSQKQKATTPKPAYILDTVAGMDVFGGDLRDGGTGRLNAEKVRHLFGLKMTALAEAAGISKQGLDQNPASEKAQPVLLLFERIARLRTHPQFNNPAALRKWFRCPLPLLSNHSAEDLFKAGKLEFVAEKVDQLLTGDFGG